MVNLISQANFANSANKGTEKIYLGLGETTFKGGVWKPQQRFLKSTELSKYMLLLKEEQVIVRIRLLIAENV